MNLFIALVGLCLAACFLLPGLTMLLYPKKAFTTSAKPRWLGFLVLLGGAAVFWPLWHWLITPAKRLPLPLDPRDVPYTWKVAAMRRRIHAGMTIEQVHDILGHWAYVQSTTPPGDIPDAPDELEMYKGQDGWLYVYYRLSESRGSVVTYASTEDIPGNGFD